MVLDERNYLITCLFVHHTERLVLLVAIGTVKVAAQRGRQRELYGVFPERVCQVPQADKVNGFIVFPFR